MILELKVKERAYGSFQRQRTEHDRRSDPAPHPAIHAAAGRDRYAPAAVQCGGRHRRR